MPIYEYQCQKCGEVSEYMQKMSDPPMTECEACGGSLSRLISKSAFHLKGGGWYKDLYASPHSDNGKSNGAKAGANGASAGSAAGSGDASKPAATGSGDSTAKPAASKPATKE